MPCGAARACMGRAGEGEKGSSPSRPFKHIVVRTASTVEIKIRGSQRRDEKEKARENEGVRGRERARERGNKRQVEKKRQGRFHYFLCNIRKGRIFRACMIFTNGG